MAKGPRSSLLNHFLARIRPSASQPERVVATVRPFQAVSIYRGITACPMAHRFSEHRFLAKDVPTLPLSGCTMRQTCQCTFVKHRDRRSVPRRVVDFRNAIRTYKGKDRRLLKGRRSND